MGLTKQLFNILIGRANGGLEGRIRRAEAGDAFDQFHLGLHYEQGQFGLPQDYCEAAKWYRKAAEQGHAGGQLYLGILLAAGHGVEQDFVEAYKWVELAKRGNTLDRIAAKETQGKLIEFMTADQIAQGQQLSRTFERARRARKQ